MSDAMWDEPIDTEAAAENESKTKEEIQPVRIERVLELLSTGEIEVHGLIPWSSNYTFLATVRHGSLSAMAVYKPQRGETPLWDFPDGTLCLREMAAYLVSQLLGWPSIPPTVLREGPHGLGTLQLYIDHDMEANYFTFREERLRDLMPIALFDLIANNADRKGGHCLLGYDDRIWAIDHGLTFHTQHKLRTVIWDFQGQPIPHRYLHDLEKLRQLLLGQSEAREALERLLTEAEIRAFLARIERLLRSKRFPPPGPGRSYPWPPV